MEYSQATLRLPKPLSDKLRRAAKRAHKPMAVVVRDAIDHWTTDPVHPGCPHWDQATHGDLAALRDKLAAGRP